MNRQKTKCIATTFGLLSKKQRDHKNVLEQSTDKNIENGLINFKENIKAR